MKKCSSCSARNDDQAIVCSLCGARLGAGAPPPKAGAKPAPAGRPGVAASPRGAAGGWPDGRKAEPRTDASGPIIEPRLWQAGKPRAARTTIRVQEQHYLVPPFGELLKLDPGEKPLVLGRDEECDIMIASPTVSRRHAEMLFRGEPLAPVVRDLGTKNGTRVNGKKLPKGSERALADNDVVRLGDVTAIYRVLPPGEDARSLKGSNSGTVQMQADDVVAAQPADPSLETSAGLKGDLSFFPMVDLLARLAKMRASGTLAVDVDGVKGSVAFAHGAIQNANVAGLEGPSAIQALSELRRGRFRFEPGKA